MVLKDCSRCMIYTAKGHRFAEGRVVHTNTSVVIYFDNYKMKDTRFQARVDFFDEQVGLVMSVCEVTIHRNPAFPDIAEPWMADCRILEVKDIVQRQRDVRVRVYLEVKIKSERYGTFYGTIRNLSAGGMYMTTIQPMNRDDHITFTYCFRTLERQFEAVTLWVKRVEGDRYGYGCRFINMTAGAESAIREYVFKKQLDKEKGKS